MKAEWPFLVQTLKSGSVTPATFYGSKRDIGHPRFKGRGFRLHLLMEWWENYIAEAFSILGPSVPDEDNTYIIVRKFVFSREGL